MFRGDVFIPHIFRDRFCVGENARGGLGRGQAGVSTIDFRLRLKRFFDVGGQPGVRSGNARQDCRNEPVALTKERKEQVTRFDRLMREFERDLLRLVDGFDCFLSVLFIRS